MPEPLRESQKLVIQNVGAEALPTKPAPDTRQTVQRFVLNFSDGAFDAVDGAAYQAVLMSSG